jgi:hypothetical protein
MMYFLLLLRLSSLPNSRCCKGKAYEKYVHENGTEQPEDPGSKAMGVVALADAIKNNSTLLSVNVMGNKIGTEQLAILQGLVSAASTALVSLCGIADDATEAELSGLGGDTADALVLATELPNKRFLSKLTFGGTTSGQQPATLEVGMTDADFRNKNLGIGGATIVIAWMKHKDQKGMLSSLHIGLNGVPREQMKKM